MRILPAAVYGGPGRAAIWASCWRSSDELIDETATERPSGSSVSSGIPPRSHVLVSRGTMMGLDAAVAPLHATFGCVVQAPAAAAALTAAEFKAQLRGLMREHGIVLVEGLPQDLSAPQMVELMTAFGQAEGMLTHSDTPIDPELEGRPTETATATEPAAAGSAVPGCPQVRRLGNTMGGDGRPEALLARIGYQWHTDSGGRALTGMLCKASPASGAETLFACSAAMFERLEPAQRRLALEEPCIHSNRFTAGGPAAYDGAFGVRMNATGTRLIQAAERRRPAWALHAHARPLAARNEETGRVHLMSGANAKNIERIGDLSVEASRDALEEIMLRGLNPVEVGRLDHTLATVSRTVFDPQVVLAHSWRPGQLMLWDNRRFLHSTTPVEIYTPGEPRLMWQIIMNLEASGGHSYDDPSRGFAIEDTTAAAAAAAAAAAGGGGPKL